MNNKVFFRPDCKLPGNAREAMNVYKLAKGRIPPPPDMAQQMAHALGLPEGILQHEAWRALLENSALEQLVTEEYSITFREEARNQYGRIDISDYLRTFGRFLKVLVNPAYRAIYCEALASPQHPTITILGMVSMVALSRKKGEYVFD